MYKWVDENTQSEKKEGWTDEQYHYKLRKKAIRPFKKEMWSMDSKRRSSIMKDLEARIRFLFGELNIGNTYDYVDKFVTPLKIHKTIDDFGKPTITSTEVKGLSD